MALKVNNYDLDSIGMINAIKASASSEYQNRVPDATRTNLATVGDSIMNYQSTRNEFLNSLIDRIGLTLIKSATFENPLQSFKSATMQYGKDVEEVFVDLVNAQTYDSDLHEQDLFKQHKPDVKTCFHTLNRTDVYTITVNDEQLKRAFLDVNGLENLITTIISRPIVSNNLDEFLHMKNLFNVAETSGKMASIQVNAVTDEASAKNFVATVKEVSNDLTFLKTDYNYAGVFNNTPKSKQVLLLNTKYDARIDVELLAQAFNMDKADISIRKIVVDNFGQESQDIVAILCSEDYLIVKDVLQMSDTQRNPKGLYTNYFLHVHQILSSSVFENCVAFKLALPEIDTLTLTPSTASASKNSSVQFVAKATGTGNPSSKCEWGVTGALSSKTFISSLGLLYIANDETATTLTVTAMSVLDETVNATATVAIV